MWLPGVLVDLLFNYLMIAALGLEMFAERGYLVWIYFFGAIYWWCAGVKLLKSFHLFCLVQIWNPWVLV